jgi:Xaa-Pro dipeptidase
MPMQTTTPYPRFSDAEMTRRYAAVRALMLKEDLAALLVYGTASAFQAVHYLSNFAATREALLVFPAEGEPVLFIQMYNHVPTARRMACCSDVRWGGTNTAITAAEHLSSQGLAARRIGLVGQLPFQHYEALRRQLSQATFIDVSAQFTRLRLVKSEEEIASLRTGAELSDRVMVALEQEARPGLTEHDLVAIIEGAYLHLGGRTHIHYLVTTPMQHPAACVPAQYPSWRRLERGDVLLTEISVQYCPGYPGQILRPFTIAAPPTAEYQRLYDIAVEAFQRIAGVIRAGASSEAVLDEAEFIHKQGLTIYDDLLHGFGSGYLPPILRTRQTGSREAQPFIFEENMTVVIQPNVITQDERMGVQVGELVRVTASGVEALHHYPMRFVRCAP